MFVFHWKQSTSRNVQRSSGMARAATCYREYTPECSAQIRWKVWLSISLPMMPSEYPQRISTACTRAPPASPAQLVEVYTQGLAPKQEGAIAASRTRLWHCLNMGMSGSASFQGVRKSLEAARDLTRAVSPSARAALLASAFLRATPRWAEAPVQPERRCIA